MVMHGGHVEEGTAPKRVRSEKVAIRERSAAVGGQGLGWQGEVTGKPQGQLPLKDDNEVTVSSRLGVHRVSGKSCTGKLPLS